MTNSELTITDRQRDSFEAIFKMLQRLSWVGVQYLREYLEYLEGKDPPASQDWTNRLKALITLKEEGIF